MVVMYTCSYSLRLAEKENRLIRKAGTSYYMSTAFLIMSKSLPHAVLTVLLLHKGLSLTEIMFIQTACNATVFLFEFPSGAISSLYSTKSVYLASILACSIVIFGSGFLLMGLA